MRSEQALLEETAEELFEEAPCGYLSTRIDGTIVKVNRTFEAWTGYDRADLVERRRFQDLLDAGGRIFYETHYAPLLVMQGFVREIAVDVVRADGSRLPALVNASVRHDASGEPRVVRTSVFDATERRRYEQELLAARRREQEVARQLQRSLMPGRPPVGSAVDVGASYRPAVSTLEVGGDWYDAFWLDGDGRLGVVVGDVVGRGIEAAATMGQLRSALRALASTGLGPAGVVDALDRYAGRYGVGQMATVVVAEVDLASRRLSYACAGHPPPLLVRPDGSVVPLQDGRSLPLDAHLGDPAPRPEGVTTLDDGAIVLLYSDGVVEHRERPLDEGIAALGAAALRRPDRAMARLTEELVAELQDPEHPDDACILGLRVGGSPPGR